MEIREISSRILDADALDEKLRPIELDPTDAASGPAVRLERPANLQFAPPKTSPAMPTLAALRGPRKRGLAPHILANHELQALEVMAWALLAFPEAPAEFRRGMLTIMADEQRHTRMCPGSAGTGILAGRR